MKPKPKRFDLAAYLRQSRKLRKELFHGREPADQTRFDNVGQIMANFRSGR